MPLETFGCVVSACSLINRVLHVTVLRKYVICSCNHSGRSLICLPRKTEPIGTSLFFPLFPLIRKVANVFTTIMIVPPKKYEKRWGIFIPHL